MENKRRVRKNYHQRNRPSGRLRLERVVVARTGIVRSGYTDSLPLLIQPSEQKHISVTEWIAAALKIMTGITFLIVVSLVFIFIHDFLTQCDCFRAERIVITGIQRLSEKEVMKQAQTEPGINILSMNLPKARKLLRAHFWIADAEIKRIFPSELHIKITEHEPLAILDLGRKFIINTNGEIFKEWAASDPDYLPLVSGLTFSDIAPPGKPSNLPFQAVKEILRLGQQQGSIIPNRFIKKIKVDKEMGTTLYVTQCPGMTSDEPDRLRTIRLGYHNYPAKYDQLEHIFFYLKRNQEIINIDTIDVNNMNRIVVKGIQGTELSDGEKAVPVGLD